MRMKYKITCVALHSCLAVSAALAANLPPPGSYQIDSRATQTSSAGPIRIESELATDGATGDTVQTSRTSGQAPAVSHAKGNGPVRWCIPARTVAMPAACLAKGACTGAAPQWQQIDAKTWQVRYSRTDANLSTGSAAATIAQARSQANSPLFAALPPAEKAAYQAALASLPDAATLNRQNLEMAQEIERDAARQPPAEAAAMREQAAKLRAGTAGSGTLEWQVTERWTLVGDRCSP